MSPLAQILVIVGCMLGEAFFSGMETGVISINRMRLRHLVRQGSRSGRILQEFVNNPDRLLGTTLVGTNLFLVIISVVAASFASAVLGAFGEATSSLAVTVLVLVFCEYLPKSWFQSRPLDRCRHYAGTLRLAAGVFAPISAVIIQLTRWLVPGRTAPLSARGPFVTREDLKHLTEESARHGVLSRHESDMIHRVFGLSGKPAKAIMIPLAEVVSVDSDSTIREFVDIARESNFTRHPVHDREKGVYTGIVNVFDALAMRATDIGQPVVSLARPPLFIDQEMPVDDIFPRLRRFRQPMCLVRNAAKEVVGMITTEDILEEIVGEL